MWAAGKMVLMEKGGEYSSRSLGCLGEASVKCHGHQGLGTRPGGMGKGER